MLWLSPFLVEEIYSLKCIKSELAENLFFQSLLYIWIFSVNLSICVPAQDNNGFVANAIIELQPKISENPTSGQ